MTAVTPPPGWTCHANTCTSLPPHTHVQAPFPAELITHRFAATHHDTPDIDRVWVDWRRVAYEAWTGREMPPPAGQLTFEELARG